MKPICLQIEEPASQPQTRRHPAQLTTAIWIAYLARRKGIVLTDDQVAQLASRADRFGGAGDAQYMARCAVERINFILGLRHVSDDVMREAMGESPVSCSGSEQPAAEQRGGVLPSRLFKQPSEFPPLTVEREHE